MPDDGRSGIGGFVSEVRHSMAIDATKKVAWWVLGALVSGVALVVWQGGTVPAWTLLVAIVALLVFAGWWRSRAGRERDAVALEAGAMAFGLERHETYSRHVAQALDALQRVVSQDITVSMDRYIEQAILEPARDLLMEKAAENVRLSVLLPKATADSGTWFMPWAAGHSLTGKSKYAERIADTLSRRAYESGTPQYWPDVTADSSFTPNPEASAPIRTMISLPVRYGDRVLGVFNVVSSEPDALDPAEETYIKSLGAVLSLAVGVHLKAHMEAAEDQ